MLDIVKINKKLKKFSSDRDWDKYHSPKNLAMALSVEVSELVEIFQWLDGEESKKLDNKTINSVKEEVADILIYLLRFSDFFDIRHGNKTKTKETQKKTKRKQKKTKRHKFTHRETNPSTKKTFMPRGGVLTVVGGWRP